MVLASLFQYCFFLHVPCGFMYADIKSFLNIKYRGLWYFCHQCNAYCPKLRHRTDHRSEMTPKLLSVLIVSNIHLPRVIKFTAGNLAVSLWVRRLCLWVRGYQQQPLLVLCIQCFHILCYPHKLFLSVHGEDTAGRKFLIATYTGRILSWSRYQHHP